MPLSKGLSTGKTIQNSWAFDILSFKSQIPQGFPGGGGGGRHGDDMIIFDHRQSRRIHIIYISQKLIK